jgi:hypothetical protein
MSLCVPVFRSAKKGAARPAIEFKGPADNAEFLADAKTQPAVQVPDGAPRSGRRADCRNRDKLIHFHEGVDLEAAGGRYECRLRVFRRAGYGRSPFRWCDG